VAEHEVPASTGSTRALGVDLGERRIGLAVSDPSGTLASPLRVLLRSGDLDRDHRAIADAAREVGAGHVVVGLPRSLSGGPGRAERAVATEVAALTRAVDVGTEVHTYDERFTTVIAERGLMQANPRGGAQRRRTRIDAAAAAVMLQSWLDARAASGRS
jgi:putative Holliday junction resolvase